MKKIILAITAAVALSSCAAVNIQVGGRAEKKAEYCRAIFPNNSETTCKLITLASALVWVAGFSYVITR